MVCTLTVHVVRRVAVGMWNGHVLDGLRHYDAFRTARVWNDHVPDVSGVIRPFRPERRELSAERSSPALLTRPAVQRETARQHEAERAPRHAYEALIPQSFPAY
jgi:hypothetical protein